jgi:uncharacterized membrane protein
MFSKISLAFPVGGIPAVALFSALSVVLAAGHVQTAAAQPVFTDLSIQSGPQGPFGITRVTAVSGDGSTITGECIPQGQSNVRTFRLRAGQDIEYLPKLSGYAANITRAINADGSVIVAESNFFNVDNYPRVATRWTGAGPAENLGPVSSSYRGYTPAAVSSDGSIVLVNALVSVGTAYYPFVRLANGTYLPFTDYTHVTVGVGTSLSADGSTAIGYIRVDFGPSVAYPVAFTPGQPLKYLEFPAGGWSPIPFAVNHDGRIIYGQGRGTDGFQHLIRWIDGVIVDDNAVTWGIRSVSDDGTVFSGLYQPNPDDIYTTHACFLSFTRGFNDLNTLLPTLGVDLTGYVLTSVTGMSADGSVMAGECTYNGVARRWLLRNFHPNFCLADIDHNDVVDLNDFFAFLNCFDTYQPCADIDNIPGVDLGDFFAFFDAWDASC